MSQTLVKHRQTIGRPGQSNVLLLRVVKPGGYRVLESGNGLNIEVWTVLYSRIRYDRNSKFLKKEISFKVNDKKGGYQQ